MTDFSKFYGIQVETIDGAKRDLSQFKGKVLLIVNTASECGFTPQYEGLEKLYKQYQSQGLVVLGFPSNDYGAQEPGTNQEIAKFCGLKYQVSFPLFAKNPVKGPQKQPLYDYLLKSMPEASEEVGWNFEKFLVGRDGAPVARFKSKVAPQSPELMAAIEKALG